MSKEDIERWETGAEKAEAQIECNLGTESAELHLSMIMLIALGLGMGICGLIYWAFSLGG